MFKYFFFLVIGLFTAQAFSQGWVQTSATPVGGGVTDLLVRNNGDVLATVGSFNWPSVAGGVRKSTDGGQTWQNVASAFNGRTIEEAFDGNLYASIWFYPQNEGLYRSTDGGGSWGSPIYSVPSGNNIFSIAAKSGAPNYLLFVGTRNGVMRSTDSGASFQSANNGIPANSWVRDLEIDSSGVIAAATTNGLFTSTNNGDLWEQATGIPASDTTVTLLFDYPISVEDGGNTRLYTGSENGYIYQSFADSKYLLCTLLAIFGDGEVASIFGAYLLIESKKLNAVAVYPAGGDVGGVYVTNDTRAGFVKENNGLPSNPKVSALSGRVVQTRVSEEVEMYAGLYENTSTGAKVYKRNFVVGVESITSEIPNDYQLEQNYPNPFNPSTTIQFSIPEQSFITLEIFNALGEKVSSLVSEELNAGTYKYEWKAGNLSSGVYYYKLIANDFSQTKKLILLR
ncbi:MAG: T9SS type A sorting domain-containing protein [Ignavibacteriaceae bacterium]|nr:T9SS type A sorting domain-containing protein [Ignavibacteriaceae bacterium]